MGEEDSHLEFQLLRLSRTGNVMDMTSYNIRGNRLWLQSLISTFKVDSKHMIADAICFKMILGGNE